MMPTLHALITSKRLIGLTALAIILSGCATKSYVVLLENPDGTTGKVMVSGKKGNQTINSAHYGSPLDGSSAAAPVDEKQFQKDFAVAMAARPQLPSRYLLYFQENATLTLESETLLPKIIAEAADRPAVDVSIIGHTDTAGNAEDNETLALSRAKTIAEKLKAQGLQANSLSIESHGERNLLVATPDDTVEPQNRRVEISIR